MGHGEPRAFDQMGVPTHCRYYYGPGMDRRQQTPHCVGQGQRNVQHVESETDHTRTHPHFCCFLRFGAAFLVDSGSSVGTITGHEKPTLSCDMRQQRPYRAATCGEDFCMCFFAGPPFKLNKTQKTHTRFCNCVRYSPNGDFVRRQKKKETNLLVLKKR